MTVIHMTRYKVKGAMPYMPWPEMRHAAWSLRRVAREHLRGSAHTISAAVVMTAFSVEAFCQTLGPEVLTGAWDQGRKKAERWPILVKLQAIAEATGVEVDYDALPWSQIKELFEARDRLAHAKPDDGKFDRIVEVPDDVDPVDHCYELREREFQPLHNIDRLDHLADEIDKMLLPIWTGAGHREGDFTVKPARHFQISAPGDE